MRPLPSELETPPVTKMNLLTPTLLRSRCEVHPTTIIDGGHAGGGREAAPPPAGGRAQQLARVGPRGVAARVPREHARQLGHARFSLAPCRPSVTRPTVGRRP